MLASLQKRVALFLLRRAIGQFLQSDLDPASLDVQLLGRGCVVLKDLELNLNVLNELLRSTPVRVTQGFVGQITATIPWRDLWSGLCSLELSDVKIGLTLTDDLGVSETSAAEETPILSSSIHFAGDFLRSDISDDEELDLPSGGANSRSGRKDVEGVQLLAKLIDHVMSTLGFSIRNLEVSFSASAEDSKKLVFFLPSVSYGDETAKEGSGGVSGVLASFATKSVAISGFSFKLVDENVGSSADKYALLLSSPYSDENSATIRVRQDIGEPLEETMYATASENLARSLHSAKNKSRPTWDIVVDFATIHSAIRVEDIAGLISFVTGIQPSAKVEVTPSIESKPPSPDPEESRDRSFQIKVNIREIKSYLFTNSNAFVNFDGFFDPSNALAFDSDHYLLSIQNLEFIFVSQPSADGGPASFSVSVSSAEFSDWISSAGLVGRSTPGSIPLDRYFPLLRLTSEDTRSVLESCAPLFEDNPPRSWILPFARKATRSSFQRGFSVSGGFGGESSSVVRLNFGLITANVDLRLLDRLSQLGERVKPHLKFSPNHSSLDDAESTPAKFDVDIAAIRVWLFVPKIEANDAAPGHSLDWYSTRPEALVLELDRLHIEDKSANESAWSSFAVSFRAIAASVARPYAGFWKEYEVLPFLLAGPEPPLLLSQQSSSGTILIKLSRATTEVESLEPLPFPNTPDADDELFNYGFQSWYDLGDKADRSRQPRAAVNEEIEDPVQALGRNSKAFVEVDIGGIFIHLAKAELDSLQLLGNEIQRYPRLVDAGDQTEKAEASSVFQFTSDTATNLGSSVSSEDISSSLHQLCVSVGISMLRVSLHTADYTASSHSSYSIEANGLKGFVVSGLNGKDLTQAKASARTLSVTDQNLKIRLLHPRPSSLLGPNFSLFATLSFDKLLDMKETSIVVNFADLLASISVETKLVPHLTALFEEPEGLVYEDDFNRFTKLTVNLTQIEVDYVPLYKPVRLNLSTERLKITCSIIPNSPSFALKLTLRNLVAALADSTGSLSSEPESPSQLVNVLAVSTLSVSVRFSDGLISPKFELEASNDEVVIETCSDSLAAMMNLLQYIGRSGDFPTEIPPPAMSQPQPKTAGSPTALSMDILASLEENEFVHSSGNRDLANRSNLRFVSIDDLDSGLDDGEYVQADLGSPPLSEDAGVTDDAVQVFDDEQSFMISPDHFALYGGPPSDEQDTDSRPLLQVKVKELNIIWRLFDGSDWQHPIAQEGELDFEENAETEMSTSQTDEDEDLFLESIPSHFSAKTPRTPRPKHHETRSAECRVEFRFSKINVEFEKYSDDSQRASKLSIFVRDVEVIDNVQTSLWRKFLSPLRPNSDDLPRETRSDMLTFEMINVRPNPSLPAQEEIRLKAQLLPLRLHIDQDALMFLIDFFNDGRSEPTSQSPSTSPSDESFFQLCHIYPISMKIDYKPKHVDYKSLKGGNFVEIMNFFPLDGAEMTLRDVRVTGVKGWSRLGEIVLGKWLPHVSTQVPRVVSGVSGVRSLVNLGSGIANLILLPIEQYRKDGRIVRGLQKGAKSFAKAATMETLRLGTRVAVGTQVLLEQADTLISAERDSGPARERRSKLSEQPKDLKEGIELGYRSISKNLGYAAKTILAVPMEVRQSSGTAQSVIRAVPVAVLKPMIGATEMVSKTLMGLQNSIDPNKRLQMEDKYKA